MAKLSSSQGTTSDQDNRFSDKEKKLLKQMKFEESLSTKVGVGHIADSYIPTRQKKSFPSHRKIILNLIRPRFIDRSRQSSTGRAEAVDLNQGQRIPGHGGRRCGRVHLQPAGSQGTLSGASLFRHPQFVHKEVSSY